MLLKYSYWYRRDAPYSVWELLRFSDKHDIQKIVSQRSEFVCAPCMQDLEAHLQSLKVFDVPLPLFYGTLVNQYAANVINRMKGLPFLEYK